MRSLVAVCLVVCALAWAAHGEECGVKCKARTERMRELRDKSPSGVVSLNTDGFTELLRTAPREYTAILVLNAVNPAHNCQPCP